MFSYDGIRQDRATGLYSLNDLLVKKCRVKSQRTKDQRVGKLKNILNDIQMLRINGKGRITPGIPRRVIPWVMLKYTPNGDGRAKYTHDLMVEFADELHPGDSVVEYVDAEDELEFEPGDEPELRPDQQRLDDEQQHKRRMEEMKLDIMLEKQTAERAQQEHERTLRRKLVECHADNDPELLYILTGVAPPKKRARAKKRRLPIASSSSATADERSLLEARDAEIAAMQKHIAALTNEAPTSKRVLAARDEHILSRPTSTRQCIGGVWYTRRRGQPLEVEHAA